ncbi:hypothetical protein Tco_0292564, partial [Tanacetum coccineum]
MLVVVLWGCSGKLGLCLLLFFSVVSSMLPSKLTPNLLQSCFSSLEFHLVHPLLQHLSLQKPVVPDSEETLMLAKESHSKMLLKQKDPMMLEKKVNTTPVDYDNSVNSLEPTLSSRPTKVEVPKELPKISMVNTSLKKLKYHLATFDMVVKDRTTPTAITKGSWG